MNLRYDVVVAGAGAAGMMCAAQAAQRGRKVLVIDHAKAPGEKIRISGGGRCNFTNINTTPNNFLSENPRFCISALRRYRPKDFIALVDSYGIAHHEKTLGQLFCDGSARQIIDLLLAEMGKGDAELRPPSRPSVTTTQASPSRPLPVRSPARAWSSPPAASRSPRWAPQASAMTWPGSLAWPSPTPAQPSSP
mgnify:CR=1 FL=1